MKVISVKDARLPQAIGKQVKARGWVRTRRDSKGVSFIEINDGSCFGNIQVIADNDGELRIGNQAPDGRLQHCGRWGG
jgi:asparaginyl-tRNA synthetase